MAKAHDDVAAGGLQRVHLILSNFEHGLTGGERHAFDLAGVGLCGGLRGFQTEHADLLAAGGGEDLVVPEGRFAVIQGVGGEDGELGGLGQLHKIIIAVVKLVVSQRSGVIAREVHQLNGCGALRGADAGIALNIVSGVQQQNIGAAVLIILLQCGHLGIARNGAVDIIGVQNHGRAGQVRGRSGNGGSRSVCRRRDGNNVGSAGGDSQRAYHRRCQQQGKELFHAESSFLNLGTHLRTAWKTGTAKCRGYAGLI